MNFSSIFKKRMYFGLCVVRVVRAWCLRVVYVLARLYACVCIRLCLSMHASACVLLAMESIMLPYNLIFFLQSQMVDRDWIFFLYIKKNRNVPVILKSRP
jgi:hypothetical protein